MAPKIQQPPQQPPRDRKSKPPRDKRPEADADDQSLAGSVRLLSEEGDATDAPPLSAAESVSSIESGGSARGSAASVKDVSLMVAAMPEDECDALLAQLMARKAALAKPVAPEGAVSPRIDGSATSPTRRAASSLAPDVPDLFEDRLSAITANPNVLCPPSCRAALKELNRRGIDALPLLQALPDPSTKQAHTLQTADAQRVTSWSEPLPPEFDSAVRAAISLKPGHAQIPFEAWEQANKLIHKRSFGFIRSGDELKSLSINGFMNQIGHGNYETLFKTPQSSSDLLELAPAPRNFDASSLPLGHVRTPLTQDVWALFAAVTEPFTLAVLGDRRRLNYALSYALVLFAAVQKFMYLLATTIAAIGQEMNARWSEKLQRMLPTFCDGSRIGANINFVPTAEAMLFLEASSGCAHMHGSEALQLLVFAKCNSREQQQPLVPYSMQHPMAYGAPGMYSPAYGYCPPSPGFNSNGGYGQFRVPSRSSGAADGSDESQDPRALMPSSGWSQGWDPSSLNGR